jgi:flagella basal body P-ring formation protein FlgA
MIWCGNLLVLLLATGPVDVPAGLAAGVREAIARGWRVDPSRVELQWGRIGTRDALAEQGRVRILGQGRDGRFVVTLPTGAGGETAVSVRAGITDSVWVAARPIAMGARLGRDDIRRDRLVVWGPPAPAPIEPPLGFEVARTLAEGDRLTAPSVAEPPVISPGDRIVFVWEQDGLRIVREATAGSRARRGERVIGRDDSRHEQLTGVALGPGTARLERKQVP